MKKTEHKKKWEKRMQQQKHPTATALQPPHHPHHPRLHF